MSRALHLGSDATVYSCGLKTRKKFAHNNGKRTEEGHLPASRAARAAMSRLQTTA